MCFTTPSWGLGKQAVLQQQLLLPPVDRLRQRLNIGVNAHGTQQIGLFSFNIYSMLPSRLHL